MLTRVAVWVQVELQLETEKAALLEKKRQEQAERRRTQEELSRILEDNRRKVHACCEQPLGLTAAATPQIDVPDKSGPFKNGPATLQAMAAL